jgi:hypothetical protein
LQLNVLYLGTDRPFSRWRSADTRGINGYDSRAS